MAQNSRIAVASHNTMARSTTSIEPSVSNERTKGEGSLEGPEINAITSAGDTDSTRILSDNEMNDSQNSNNGNQRFWFPSVTTWCSELNKAYAVTVIILCYCNLINYMDRSTVAGMISFIKEDKDFNVHSDKKMGLLQVHSIFIFVPYCIDTIQVYLKLLNLEAPIKQYY